jgi:hypothetical protein
MGKLKNKPNTSQVSMGFLTNQADIGIAAAWRD